MSEIIGSYQVSAFIAPVNGTANDADPVRGNDNTLRAALNGHDSDAGIHVQSSTLAQRPVAGTAVRIWFTTDDRRVFLDDGSSWQEINYAQTASPTFTGTVTVAALTASGAVTFNGTVTYNGALVLANQLQTSNGVFTSTAAITTFQGSGANGIQIHASNVAGVIAFATNSTGRWKIDAAGHFSPQADNLFDIGLTAARVRTLYVKTSIDISNLGAIFVNGLQVVFSRQTGYATWAGLSNRAGAFDQATVTLAQLASRVNALQQDLTVHGLIGP